MAIKETLNYITMGLLGLALSISVLPAAMAETDVPGNTLKVACNEAPPFKMSHADGSFTGLDIDLLDEIFDRMGIAHSVAFYPWRRTFELAKNGVYDAICSCSYRDDRTPFFAYSDQIGEIGIGVFTRTGFLDEQIRSLDDLAGINVGVVSGYNLEQELREKGYRPFAVASNFKGVELLIKGRIDAFFTFRAYALHEQLQHFKDTKLDYYSIRTSPYYVCFSKAADDFRNKVKAFNETFATVQEDGTLDEIRARYLPN